MGLLKRIWEIPKGKGKGKALAQTKDTVNQGPVNNKWDMGMVEEAAGAVEVVEDGIKRVGVKTGGIGRMRTLGDRR